LATDATGTPTSPDSIPKYNTSVDAPSGLGFNAAMDQIQVALSARASKPAGIVSGEAMIWNGTTFVRSSVTGLTPSGIAGYPASVFSALRGDGTWGNTHIVYDKTAANVVVNTTAAETNLYSKQINGNDLGTAGIFVLELAGFYIHNNVAGDTLTWRFKYGGTAGAFTATSLGGTTGAAARAWFMKVVLSGNGTTNSQTFTANYMTENVAGAASLSEAIYTGPTVDSTVNQNLVVTAQWSASSVNDSVGLTSAVLTRF
jgi:hypothetical protein